MKTDEVRLEDIWDAEQSILDEIDKVCRENNLRYSLAYGTLLGAVRHGGFIPWDDDIDIMMPREDYEKLLEIWPDVANEVFILQDENSVEGYENNFAKIRKDHTTFLQFESERKSARHKGFFVDVFPADRRPSRKVARLIQKLCFALNLLFNRGYPSGAKGIVGFVERTLLKVVPKKKYGNVSKLFGKKSRKWNDNKSNTLVFAETMESITHDYPSNMFDEFVEISFKGKTYKAVADKEEYLKAYFGDYMQLPPEEERVWKHQPILVDFEHNYEELR